MTQETNNKIKAILTTEIKYILSIVVFVAGVVAPYYSIRTNISLIQQDVANIKKVIETHIENKTISQDETDKDLNNRMTVVETKLNLKKP